MVFIHGILPFLIDCEFPKVKVLLHQSIKTTYVTIINYQGFLASKYIIGNGNFPAQHTEILVRHYFLRSPFELGKAMGKASIKAKTTSLVGVIRK
jgi:hypothetical protein